MKINKLKFIVKLKKMGSKQSNSTTFNSKIREECI